MFVKLVVSPEWRRKQLDGSSAPDSEDDKGKEKTWEETIECKGYSFHYDAKNYKEGTFFLDISKGTGPLTRRIELQNTCVYIMSDTGKTIDSFAWSLDSESKRCARL